jgi:hypothetical protein
MTDAQRCEPPEHLRGVEGFYWLYDIHTSARCPYIWNPRICRWKRFGGSHTRTPAQMRSDGWVYEAPVASNDLVRELVEALTEAASAMQAACERDDLMTDDDAETITKARAALRRAKEAGV